MRKFLDITALDVIEMNRVAYKKSCRRRDFIERALGFVRMGFWVVGLMACFVYRAELSSMFDNVWSSYITTVQSAHVRR